MYCSNYRLNTPLSFHLRPRSVRRQRSINNNTIESMGCEGTFIKILLSVSSFISHSAEMPINVKVYQIIIIPAPEILIFYCLELIYRVFNQITARHEHLPTIPPLVPDNPQRPFFPLRKQGKYSQRKVMTSCQVLFCNWNIMFT